MGLASIGWSSLSYPQGQMNQEFDYSYPGTVAGPLIPNSLGPNIADLNGQKSSSAEYAVISNNAPIYLGRSHSFLVILKLDTPPPYNTWLTILNIFPLNNQVTEYIYIYIYKYIYIYTKLNVINLSLLYYITRYIYISLYRIGK